MNAVAEDGQTLSLLPDTDNWAALQSFCDAHTSIQFSAGQCFLSRTLNVKSGSKTWRGAGVDATTFKRIGVWNGPVIGIGGIGRWTNGYAGAANFTLAGMTLWQTDNSSTNNKCFWSEGGDNLLIENVRVRGSIYEGIVTGSSVDGVTVRNFEAWDCGNGEDDFYERTTAGINCTSRNLLCEDFVTLRCGQGIEGGNSPGGIFRRGSVSGPSGLFGPSLGVNIGSTGRGIYRLTVEDVIVSGYATGMAIGPNGIGRFCGITVQRNDVEGGISFSGGKTVNAVPGQPGEGPDTEGSYILDNIIRINGLSDSSAVLYNTGPSPDYEVYGREPLSILRNEVIYDGTPQTTPTFGFAGKVVASVYLRDNIVNGLDASPTRGDIASFTSGSNTAVPGMPSLSYSGNRYYKRSLIQRDQLRRIEGL